MCGILFSSIPGIDRQAFAEALELMHYRGPDGGAVEEANANLLGHRRLKIQDLSDHANQPFTSASGRYTVVFNGEIYNFRELKQKHGLTTRTDCDVEVLVELYERLQERCLDEFNGMFAFVVLDRQSGEVFAARDRLGIKPLYWHRGAEGVLFSSEIKPIRALVAADKISEEGLRQYLKLRTFFNNRTLFDAIDSFPAGHYFKHGRLYRYWALPEQDGGEVDRERLQTLLASAVEYRKIADVPVGTFLSGGLDSTVVTHLAGGVTSWSAGSREANEFDWAALAAHALGVEHRQVEITPAAFRETWDTMVAARGEPLSVPNEVLLHFMARRLKQQITVVLSGEGADELFLGYDRLFRWAAQAPWDLHEFDARYSYSSHADPEIVDSVIAPFKGRSSTLETVYAFFQVAHLHGLLRRLDFATMLAGVEARVPFVDHRLVEYVARTDPHRRHDPSRPKHVLKEAFEQRLPAAIVNRPKIGFPVDLGELMEAGADYSSFLGENLRKLGINRTTV